MQVFRIINNSTLTAANVGLYESFIPNPVYTQCVRWKRKPIWLPPAKSKMFRVPQRPVIPIEDGQNLKNLYNSYRTYMKSLREYLNKTAKENEMEFGEETVRQAKEEDFEACSVINDEWNAKVAKEREARLAIMKEARKERILQHILKVEQEEEELRKKIDEKIKKTKEESATFITAENVDAAIEECLTTIVNHNQALDVDGNWHEGKYPPPTPLLTEVQTSAAEQ